MAASDNFEAWLIAWPPGGCIELHNHGHSAGAVVVVGGELSETTGLEDQKGECCYMTRVVGAGESVSFGQSYIHSLANIEAAPALSVHAYSPRLTAMTHFKLLDGRLEPSHTVRYHAGLSVP